MTKEIRMTKPEGINAVLSLLCLALRDYKR